MASISESKIRVIIVVEENFVVSPFGSYRNRWKLLHETTATDYGYLRGRPNREKRSTSMQTYHVDFFTLGHKIDLRVLCDSLYAHDCITRNQSTPPFPLGPQTT